MDDCRFGVPPAPVCPRVNRALEGGALPDPGDSECGDEENILAGGDTGGEEWLVDRANWRGRGPECRDGFGVVGSVDADATGKSEISFIVVV